MLCAALVENATFLTMSLLIALLKKQQRFATEVLVLFAQPTLIAAALFLIVLLESAHNANRLLMTVEVTITAILPACDLSMGLTFALQEASRVLVLTSVSLRLLFA